MRFVLANRHLRDAGGTEVHLVTIGEHLQRLGHEVVLYAPVLGAFADHAFRRGLAVSGSLRELPTECDVVFAQDAIVVYDLAARYPDALSIFRICGDYADFQLPPQVDGVVDLYVVLSDRYERIAMASAVTAPVLRLRIPIDVDRLVPLGAIRECPQRAVLLGNYQEREQLVAEVWGRHGVQVRRVGRQRQTFDVATAVADADIVVAKSRAALDAMACGRAVYVYDLFGGDGWVTPEVYASFEADHFAGQATDRVIDAAALSADLAGYRQEMGSMNRDLVLQHHSARDHVVALLNVIGNAVRQPRNRGSLEELSRLVALQWSFQTNAQEVRTVLRKQAEGSEQRAAIAAAAAQRMQADRDAAVARATVLEARLAGAEQELARLPVRIAGRLSGPVQRPSTPPGTARYWLDDQRSVRGWYRIEIDQALGTYRWSGAGPEATISLPADERPVRIAVRVLRAIAPESLDGVSMTANGKPLDHTTERQPDGTFTLHGSLEAASEASDDGLDLTIRAPTSRPADVGLGPDERPLGLAVAWVEIRPMEGG